MLIGTSYISQELLPVNPAMNLNLTKSQYKTHFKGEKRNLSVRRLCIFVWGDLDIFYCGVLCASTAQTAGVLEHTQGCRTGHSGSTPIPYPFLSVLSRATQFN